MVHVVQSKEDFEQQLSNAGDKLIVIDFCANWCGPCKLIAPKLEELAAQYAERAVVLKVNVDDNEDITTEYNISSMPTFVFIKSGELLEVFVGGNPDKLCKSMEKHVGDADEPDEQPLAQQVSASSGSAGSGNTMCDDDELDEDDGDLTDDVPMDLPHPTINDERVLEN
ncbi:thioredoxin-T [Drosophila albomicans]|uniref:Thioredoxin-T n=1 Tax=Drosophila albomicans TaxID=7291 RepID=A0A6P8WCB0_DROAB|nr:thioredoxin-T [Drosophila albomicans]XP_051862734.1 thioredoxin-T [Drosophila albomicans]